MSNAFEKAKGAAKEVVGDAVGAEGLQEEGRHQQEKARKLDEAVEHEEKAQEKAREAAGHAGAEKRAQES